MHRTRIALGALLLLLCCSGNLFAQSFTYQGLLKASGVPANAQYDFRFRLYTTLTGGSQVGSDLLVNELSVQNGLFTAELNFGAVWDGSERYLEIAVRPGSSTGAYTVLSPRVKINPTPYAAFAQRPWVTSGSNIFYNAGNVSIGTNSSGYPLLVEASGTAVYAASTSINGYTFAVSGRSDSSVGTGVVGWTTATSGDTTGVYGLSWSNAGIGVYGRTTATSGTTFGVYGRIDSNYGAGVYGYAPATSGETVGVWGQSASTSGRGVFGSATASSGGTVGVYGQSSSTSGTAVVGWATARSGTTYGGWFESASTTGRGVMGVATASSGTTYGVIGQNNINTLGYAVYSIGRFAATGTKAFQIDHPLNPENAYLNHFCTEAPEPLNAYSGNVTTDAQGYAVVQLPDYFESINRDFRYQLTCIGQFAQAIVAEEIRNNRFVIRTDKPYVKVSWRVEAVRNDRWVQEYGYQAEQPKPAEYRGKYLHPELYGQPKELGIHHRPTPEREVAPVERVR